MEMPAAMLTISVVGFRIDAMELKAAAITYGFTDRMSTSTFLATSALSCVVCTSGWKLPLREFSDGEETHTLPGATIPFTPSDISPRIKAVAMLPAPINPTLTSRPRPPEIDIEMMKTREDLTSSQQTQVGYTSMTPRRDRGKALSLWPASHLFLAA